jgi:hypothetical protein
MTKSPRKKSEFSLFNWESSDYGGFRRIVWDHPIISMPDNFVFHFEGESKWFGETLCKIFMLKIKNKKLEDMFFQDKTYKDTKHYNLAIISKSSIENCYKELCKDHELGNLFIHYQEFYSSMQIEIIDDPYNAEESLMDKIRIRKPWWEKYGDENITNPELKDKTKFIAAESSKKWHSTASQEKISDSIVRLLDISFDPHSDKIENLRCGKMSSHKIAEVPAGNSHIYHRIEEDVITKPFSVVILCDESGSMAGIDLDSIYTEQYCRAAEWQNHLVKCLYLAFEKIMPANKIFIYGHTGDETPDVHIYQEAGVVDFRKSIRYQEHVEFQKNYDGPVVENIYERIRSKTSDRIIFISISDGEPSGVEYGGNLAKNELKRIIEKCKRDEFVTVGIGMRSYNGVKDIYQYHTAVKNSEDIIRNVPQLINLVVKNEFK